MMQIGNNTKNTAHPALGHFLSNVNLANKSLSILINSDSTGNEVGEWVYHFSVWLTTKYPKYTIRYRMWDDTNNVYLAPSSLNTGTTAFFIDVWNFAVAGAAPHYILGYNKISNSLKNICNKTTYTDVSDQIDLIISNHGHNAWSDGRAVNNVLYHAMASESILQMHPYASFMQIRQNPFRDDYTNKDRIQWSVEWAMMKGFAIANVWDKFEALSKASYLYADNIHPSTGLGNTGTQLFLNAVTEQLNRPYNYGDARVFDSSLNLVAKNVFANADFSTWTDVNAAPDGWTLVGGTCVKDTSDFIDTTRRFSCKITATGGVACNIKYELYGADSDKLEGGWYTLAVRMKVSATVGNVTNGGRVSFISNTDTTTSPSLQYLNGEWHWRFMSVFLKPTDSYIRAQIHVDTSTTALAGQTVNIDRCVVVKGKMPYGAGVN